MLIFFPAVSSLNNLKNNFVSRREFSFGHSADALSLLTLHVLLRYKKLFTAVLTPKLHKETPHLFFS